MQDKYIPPIKDRSVQELLEIVTSPEKWQPEVVRLAEIELGNRKIPAIKKKTAKYLAQKRERIKKERKANESYEIWDFIFNPTRTIFEILFSLDLKKDGYIRKAKQQQYFRLIIILIALITFIYTFIKT